jgi:hypothetical protein
MTNRHFWAYCTCGWITFAGDRAFAEQLVLRHLRTRPSHDVTFSRQTPEERDSELQRIERDRVERARVEHQRLGSSGVPIEVQDPPTTNFPRDRQGRS